METLTASYILLAASDSEYAGADRAHILALTSERRKRETGLFSKQDYTMITGPMMEPAFHIH